MYRGADADSDEKFVRALCQKYGIKLFVKRKNAVEYAEELKITEEEAGRILRYDFFRENIAEIGGGKIAVAHNANDQAETVLQRIIRGSGVDGLSAMAFENEQIIRPMLNVERVEIEKYLAENKYEFCTDKTNAKAIYGRNKIRLNLIPYLEKNFNPNIQNTLFRMSEAMERDSKIIHDYIHMKYLEVLISEDENEIRFDLKKLKTIKSYESGRIVKKAIQILNGTGKDIEMKHVEYVNEFILSGKTGKTINLTAGIVIEISYNDFIVRKTVEKTQKFEYNIVVGKNTYIKELDCVVSCRLIGLEEYRQGDKDCINLDYDLVQGSLKVRNRREGDTMIPCGMSGNKKL
jgi:tRNA(Ile)-lysidine synthase